MIQFLLDTDHISLHERGNSNLRQHLQSVSPDRIGVSVVTMEEMIRGRLAILSRRSEGEGCVQAYAKLMETVRFFSSIPVLPFDASCEAKFQTLRSLRLRVGTQDLRIAATALVQGATVVTRNRRDFGRIPELVIVDWS